MCKNQSETPRATSFFDGVEADRFVDSSIPAGAGSDVGVFDNLLAACAERPVADVCCDLGGIPSLDHRCSQCVLRDLSRLDRYALALAVYSDRHRERQLPSGTDLDSQAVHALDDVLYSGGAGLCYLGEVRFRGLNTIHVASPSGSILGSKLHEMAPRGTEMEKAREGLNRAV